MLTHETSKKKSIIKYIRDVVSLCYLGMALLLTGCPAFINQPPVAIANATPLGGEAPLTVSFDGSQSFDPDAATGAANQGIVSFKWDFDGDGTIDVEAQSPSVKFTYESEGVFQVVLKVTDSQGATDSDKLFINVGRASIYFSSNRDGDFEIFRMDTDGNNQAQVTTNASGDIFPALMPNTRDQLAFASDRDTATFDIFVSDPNGALPANLTSAQTASHEIEPTWSPDGEFLAFASDQNGVFEIFVMTSTGTVLNGGDPLVSQSPSHAISPAWRPVVVSETATSKTHELVFVSYNAGTGDTDLKKVKFTINLTTPPTITSVTVTNLAVDAAVKDGALGGPTFAIAGLVGSATPSWKPDGSRIAFTRQITATNLDIFTMKSDGTDVKNLNAECFSGNANQSGSNEFDPFWLETGDIAFVSDRDGSDQIYKVDCSGGTGVVTQLTSLGTENVHPAGEEE